MPFKLTIPLGCPDTRGNIEYTVLGPEDLASTADELDKLRQRVSRLEVAPPTAAAATNRITADAINIEGLETRAEEAEDSARNWERTAHQAQTDANYYKELMVRIGVMLGLKAKTLADGIIAEYIMCGEVPGLVNRLLNSAAADRAAAASYEGEAEQYRKLHVLLAHNGDLILMRDPIGSRVRIKGGDFRTICEGASLSDALDHLDTSTPPADPSRFYANGVPRYVKCRKCGAEGMREAEFLSPYTGLCSVCNEEQARGAL